MFDRQIDLIMQEFAPVAQRYLKHVAKINGLEKMTFADWKLDLDSALNPEVTIDDAYDLVMKSVEPLGKNIVRKLLAIKKSAGWTSLLIVARILVVMRRIRIACTLMSSWAGLVVWVMSIPWFMKSDILVNSSFRQSPKLLQCPHVDLLCRSAINLQWVASQWLLGAPVWWPTSKNALPLPTA